MKKNLRAEKTVEKNAHNNIDKQQKSLNYFFQYVENNTHWAALFTYFKVTPRITR